VCNYELKSNTNAHITHNRVKKRVQDFFTVYRCSMYWKSRVLPFGYVLPIRELGDQWHDLGLNDTDWQH
jgi:hypothetical protein